MSFRPHPRAATHPTNRPFVGWVELLRNPSIDPRGETHRSTGAVRVFEDAISLTRDAGARRPSQLRARPERFATGILIFRPNCPIFAIYPPTACCRPKGRQGETRSGLCFICRDPMRTIIYVDGFNLYYRMLEKHPHLKWLNI